MKDKGMAWMVLIALVAADGAAWYQIFAAKLVQGAAISFLDVGQGDSILLELSDGVKIMTDAGPDSSVVRALDRAMPQGDRYIDLAIITHSELDHFNGFDRVIDSYDIGAFIINGRDNPDSRHWRELLEKIEEKNIPLIILGAGDIIHHEQDRIDVLSPNTQIVESAELNDTGLVQKVRTSDFTALLTADIGFSIEEYLRKRYDLSADILKIGHHGSKYSSGTLLLSAVQPTLAVVSSGARNTYGHPAKDMLARMSAARIPVFRTDQRGTVTVRREAGQLRIFGEK